MNMGPTTYFASLVETVAALKDNSCWFCAASVVIADSPEPDGRYAGD